MGMGSMISLLEHTALNSSTNRRVGESYVVFGSSEDWSEALDLSDLNGTNGFTINGIDAYDYSGRFVSSAGDVNGDGIDDIIIGADYADQDDASGRR